MRSPLWSQPVKAKRLRVPKRRMDFRFDVYAQLVEAAAEIGPSTSLSSYSAATRALRVGEVRAPQAIPTHPDRDPTRGDILETPNRLH